MSNYQHERGWLDSEVWGNSPYDERSAWSWMIGEASWKDQTKNILGKPVILKRGQFTSSIRFMATRFKWSSGKVQRFLRKLCAWNMIKIDTQTDTGQNIITICNYNTYQAKKGKTDTPIDTPMDTGSDTAPIHPQIQTRNQSNQSSQLKNIYEDLPSGISSDLWSSFLAHRKAKKSPLTPQAEKMAINKLREMEKKGLDAAKVLEECMAQNWKGIYEPKDLTKFKKQQKLLTMKEILDEQAG